MALNPINETHALQIQAGIIGRKSGHEFEDSIAQSINNIKYPYLVPLISNQHLYIGDPAINLLNYIANNKNIKEILQATAISAGSLATSEEGKKWLSVNGASISRCKSDIIITITYREGQIETFGVSTKQCNNIKPTNAQLYFTTARGFVSLLRKNDISVSDHAMFSLRQFCGDVGYRPLDNPEILDIRKTDPRRFFWEEINAIGRNELENIFSGYQDDISKLLFQKAYIEDPFIPDFLIHKTKKSLEHMQTEVAIYSIDQIVMLSRQYQGFSKKNYSVRKGSFKDPMGTYHAAPRFGIIQMQRGGQQQHPEQLQFNLEAGYFYKLEQFISKKNS